MKPIDILRRKRGELDAIREAILAEFVVDPMWTRGAIRHMVVVRSVATRLAVREVGWPFMRKVYTCCRQLGARRIKPFNRALWRGLRRHEDA